MLLHAWQKDYSISISILFHHFSQMPVDPEQKQRHQETELLIAADKLLQNEIAMKKNRYPDDCEKEEECVGLSSAFFLSISQL